MQKVIKLATGGVALFLPWAVQAAANCEVNGQPVDCAEIAEKVKPFVGLGIGILLLLMLVGLLLTIFWFWMLIHAITKPIENKVLWIVLMIIFGIPVSIIYFFVVKLKIDKNPPVQNPPVVPPVGPSPTV